MKILKNLSILLEGIIRLCLFWGFLSLELLEPFQRIIHQEEKWLYQHPITPEYISSPNLWKMVAFLPVLVIFLFYCINRSINDVLAAIQVFTLSIPLNGVITDVIKLAVGRPRPDFMSRCWPDGNIPKDAFSTSSPHLNCTGDPFEVTEGRKSFPSGHASFAFNCWGFIFLYVSGKIGTFSHSSIQSSNSTTSFQSSNSPQASNSIQSSLKLVISMFLLLVPTVICISRTADYHHHWQDVTVGSLLGLAIVWLVYLQYFPQITSPLSHLALRRQGKAKLSGQHNYIGLV